MGLLDSLTNALGGAQGSSGPSGQVLSQVLAMLQNHPGGLGGLLQSFQQGGLGHLVESWVGTGQNLPVSADQLRNVLGSDWIGRITQATGLSQAQVEQHLSTVLPQLIDHLTPNGKLPQGDLGGLLANAAQRLLHG